MTARLRTQSFDLFRFNVLVYGIRLVTSAFIARRLGAAALGVWILLTMLPSYAEAFGRLKFDVAAVYLLGQKRYGVGEMCFTLNFLAVVMSAAFVAGFMLIEPWLTQALFQGALTDARWFYAILAVIPFHFIGMNYAYLLLHLERTRAYNYQNFIRSVVPSLLGLALIFAGYGVGGLVIGLLAGTISAAIVSVAVVHHGHPMHVVFHRGLIRDLFKIGSPMYLTGLVEYLNQYLWGLVIAFFVTPAHVTFFRLGQDRVQLMDYVPSAVNTALYPRLSKTPADGQAALAAQGCRVSGALLLLVGAIGALLAWPGVLILYGRPFLPMVAVVWLLIPGVVVGGATNSITQYFFGQGRSDLPLWISSASLACQLGLGLLLLPVFGYVGAAAAMCAAMLLQSVLRVAIFLRRSEGYAWRDLLPHAEEFRLVYSFGMERLRGLRVLEAFR